MKQINISRRGFTLIELLIVMSIIAMLAVLGSANYITSQKKARDSRRMADLEQVRAALEMSRTDDVNGHYPIQATCSTTVQAKANYAAIVTTLKTGNYLKSDVNDPLGGKSYSYCSSDGLIYDLCARFEKTTPSQGCDMTLTGPAIDIPNYGVTEP
jgi:general secretion pathway protein G